MRPTFSPLWRWVRLGAGVLIIAVVVQRLGAAPFLDGLRRVDVTSLAAAMAITAVTTVVSAWRWRLIARGLDLQIPLRGAVGSYYRSQFLNSTLPGGVLGDVHRGVLHGRQADDVSLGLRSVLWDRAAGQTVQVVVAVVTLLALASPVRPDATVVGWVLVGGVGVVALGVFSLRRGGLSALARLARLARAVRGDVRAVWRDGSTATAIVVASLLVVAGHVGVFLVAARAAGTPASTLVLLPLAMLVLLAMTVPTSLAGWGPREGVAAWAFAVAGLGAAQGVETATVYGVLSLAATLPGAAVLLLSRHPRHLWQSRGWSRAVTRAVTRVDDLPAPALAVAGSGRRTDG